MEARQCGACGAVSMLFDTKDITENYKGETITIKAMPGWYCSSCGESEFASQKDDERFSLELSEAMAKVDSELAAFVRATYLAKKGAIFLNSKKLPLFCTSTDYFYFLPLDR